MKQKREDTNQETKALRKMQKKCTHEWDGPVNKYEHQHMKHM